MDAKTAKILCKLNNDFYRKQSASFSATRQAPWSGWKRCLELIKDGRPAGCQQVSVFDLACGNLRFEEFLVAEFPEIAFDFYAVDDCNDLVPPTPPVSFQNLDILEVLQQGLCLNDQLQAPFCDLSVSFGFMHHVPLVHYREEILLSLVRQTRPEGYAVVSLWQFLNNEDMAKKAQVTHDQALEELGIPHLDEHDYLLGWKNIPGEYRYCHSFSEAEIDGLVASVAGKASLVSRFVADGRTDNLNTYLVFKVGR